MLSFVRILAVLVGAGVAIGETIRSWGVSRPIAAVVDDYLIGAFLLVAAARARQRRGTALLAGAFGFASGILYGSFFLHLQVIERADPGNIPQRLLTALIGMALAGSVLGLVLSLREAGRCI